MFQWALHGDHEVSIARVSTDDGQGFCASVGAIDGFHGRILGWIDRARIHDIDALKGAAREWANFEFLASRQQEQDECKQGQATKGRKIAPMLFQEGSSACLLLHDGICRFRGMR